jgi:hypothetical protein
MDGINERVSPSSQSSKPRRKRTTVVRVGTIEPTLGGREHQDDALSIAEQKERNRAEKWSVRFTEREKKILPRIHHSL